MVRARQGEGGHYDPWRSFAKTTSVSSRVIIIIVVTHRHHRRSPHSRVSCMLVLACMHASMHALVHAGRQVGTLTPGDRRRGGRTLSRPLSCNATPQRATTQDNTFSPSTAQHSTAQQHDMTNTRAQHASAAAAAAAVRPHRAGPLATPHSTCPSSHRTRIAQKKSKIKSKQQTTKAMDINNEAKSDV